MDGDWFDNEDDLPTGIDTNNNYDVLFKCRTVHHKSNNFPAVPPDLFHKDLLTSRLINMKKDL